MPKLMDATKQKIYQFLEENPGLHVSKIAEKMNMNISCLQEILDDLCREEVLHISYEGGFKRYYINEHQTTIHSQKMNELRKKIYTLISEHPGLNLTSIAEMLHMRVSLAEYHLFLLEKNGAIISIKETGFKRYYTKDTHISSDDRILLGLLRQEIPLKIILLLLKHPHLQHKELLEHFDIAPSTLTYHINKLLKDKIIDVQTYGAEKGYAIKNKRMVVEFLTRYKLHTMVETFTDTWNTLSYDI